MFTLNAPAKINWFLNVLRKREDGYHEVSSLMQMITLCDTLSFERADGINVITEAQIAPEDNLVYKAANLLKNTAHVTAGARIVLKKNIPVFAGLGGGSSDAAYTLMGLNRLWGIGMTHDELVKLGQSLGSDVPFFLNGSAAVVSGRGEIVSPVRLNKAYAIALVRPQANVSTAWAYSQVNPSEKLTKYRENYDNTRLFCHALETGDFALLSSIQGNDLESAVVGKYPEIEKVKRKLAEKGALFTAMSGSGATVFGVFASSKEADNALEGISQDNWRKTVNTVTSNG